MSDKNNTATAENPIEAALDAVKLEARLKVGKSTYDVTTLQDTINRVQSQAGRLKATDEAKLAAKSIREIDGGEVKYIPVAAVTALQKAGKINAATAAQIRALDMIQRGLSILMD